MLFPFHPDFKKIVLLRHPGSDTFRTRQIGQFIQPAGNAVGDHFGHFPAFGRGSALVYKKVIHPWLFSNRPMAPLK